QTPQKCEFISEKVTSYPYPKKEQFVSKDIYNEEKRLRKKFERQIEEINEASLQNISRLQEVIEEKNNFIDKLLEEFRWLEAYYGSSFQHAKWVPVDNTDNQEAFVDNVDDHEISGTENNDSDVDFDPFKLPEILEDEYYTFEEFD
ncbi:19276_t:CDS:2, partial [Racocetra fulgida]